jgi:hypothetical protein
LPSWLSLADHDKVRNALALNLFDPVFVQPKFESDQEMSGFGGAKWRGFDKDQILLMEARSHT